MINWKTRVKNKAFWIALVPALILFVQMVAAIFGFTVDFSEIEGRIIAAIDALFALLAVLGVAIDPTTNGICDSCRALGYEEPAPNVFDDDTKFAE